MDRTDLASRAGAAAVFVSLLREAHTPLSAGALKQRLRARGVEQGVVDSAWRRAQPAVRSHVDVCYDPSRGSYRYDDSGRAAPPLTPDEALERLLPARTTARLAELATIVRAALKERDDLEVRLRSAYAGNRALRAAHERQMQIDAVRALASVVSEVEELAAAGADSLVTAERVRALAQAFGLAPIGRAGEQTIFEPAWHSPIGPAPPEGSRVAVIRPGYTWPIGEEVVLIHKAQVAWLGRADRRTS